ncbi:hypothetical protein BDZ45DRAFT_245603 [Acephala macrosclerotiorum]|nr:hypothetical protein BDZ45DRAFT_245603 [Acephala macrosclerotiorum]
MPHSQSLLRTVILVERHFNVLAWYFFITFIAQSGIPRHPTSITNEDLPCCSNTTFPGRHVSFCFFLVEDDWYQDHGAGLIHSDTDITVLIPSTIYDDRASVYMYFRPRSRKSARIELESRETAWKIRNSMQISEIHGMVVLKYCR